MVILFAFPGYETLTNKIIDQLNSNFDGNMLYKQGDVLIKNFPDGESYVKLNTEVKNMEVIIVCGLDQPNTKAMTLMFISSILRNSGAKKIGLIAPYLGYMRQDKQFNSGEVITSKVFAEFLSMHIDWMVTIDPHLHRYKSLNEIYTVPCYVLHATNLIAMWIKSSVKNPFLIGPDMESEQWVSSIAKLIDVPYVILEKQRLGDKKVKISVPDVSRYVEYIPVLIDDIISTAGTMIKTVEYLKNLNMQPPICIGVHAIFADQSYADLKNSFVSKIVTCNSITHYTNIIDVSSILAKTIKDLIKI